MSLGKAVGRFAVLAVSATLLAGQAQAQTFPVKLSGASGQVLRGGPVAVPAYQIAFFTQHQGTAVGGVLTKARLTTSLAGVDEATLRKLSEEAYQDLVAKLKAANVPLLPDDRVKSAIAATGVELTPGNAEVTRIGAGITIGQSVKKAYAAFGAASAPAITGLHNPGNPTGAPGLNAISMNNKLGAAARAEKAVLVFPSLVLDFARTDAKGGRDFLGRESAGINSDLAFTLSAVSSATVLASAGDGRFVNPGWLRMTKDLAVPTPFATVAKGEGAVRALSVSTVTDSNYIDRDAARGDAVVVDVPVWTGLVRQAYGDFNTAVVAEIRKARGL
ncbi:MAG: hypothetical protein DI570_15105 [Phenylobacterium zucineum]|nr:MAG: hypothetical protein DI570_15105 [Phenylobacterium zucineum]